MKMMCGRNTSFSAAVKLIKLMTNSTECQTVFDDNCNIGDMDGHHFAVGFEAKNISETIKLFYYMQWFSLILNF